MRTNLLFLSLLSLLCVSCGGSSKTELSETDVPAVSRADDMSQFKVRYYVENDIYIDVNPDSLGKAYMQMSFNRSLEKAKPDFRKQYIQLKAAEYRLYKNGKFDGPFFKPDAKSGEDINVSPRVYDYLMRNLESSNALSQELIDKGEEEKIDLKEFSRLLELDLDRDYFDPIGYAKTLSPIDSL